MPGADGTQVADAASAASGGIDFASVPSDAQTDDQVLDIGSETEIAAEPEVQADENALEIDIHEVEDLEPGAEQQPKPGQESQLKPGTVPTELKHLMSDPKVAPIVQRLVDQHKAYADLGTVTGLRAVKAAVETAGGLEQLNAAVSKAASLDEADDAFTGTPEQQLALAEEWYTDNPAAFRSMVSQSARLMAERDPQGYAAMTGQIFTARMSDMRWDEQIEAISRAINANDPRKLQGLAQWLVDDARAKGIEWKGAQGRVDPKQSQIDRDRQNLQREQQSFESQRVQAFQGRVSDEVTSSVQTAIDGVLDKALAKSFFSPEGKKAIKADVLSDIDKAMKADRNLGRSFTTLIRSDRALSDATRAKAIQLLFARAKSLVGITAKNVIARKSKEVVTRQSRVNSQKTNAASRVDIRGGAPPVTRTKPLTKADAAKLTDDEILNS